MARSEEHGRRAFLRRLARGAVFAALVGGAGALVARDGETCGNRGLCRECGALRECKLPRAKSLKQALGRSR